MQKFRAIVCARARLSCQPFPTLVKMDSRFEGFAADGSAFRILSVVQLQVQSAFRYAVPLCIPRFFFYFSCSQTDNKKQQLKNVHQIDRHTMNGAP